MKVNDSYHFTFFRIIIILLCWNTAISHAVTNNIQTSKGPGISAKREIVPRAYTPGGRIEVHIHLIKDGREEQSVTVQESFSKECHVLQSEPAGNLLENSLKWAITLKRKRTTLVYVLQIPQTFHGIVHFKGVIGSQRIQGEQRITKNLGLIDAIADWGAHDFPPKRGQWKMHGDIITENTDNKFIYDVYGNGDCLFGSQDEGFYAYTQRSGSWSLTARAKWINRQTYESNAQLGLMIREIGPASDSKHYSLVLHPVRPIDRPNVSICQVKSRSYPQGQTATQQIKEAEQGDIFEHVEGLISGEYYFRVTRYQPKDLLIGEWSEDGIHWNVADSRSIEMNDSVSYGLVVSNQMDSPNLAHARFDKVSLSPPPPIAIRSFSTDYYQSNEAIEVGIDIINCTTKTENILLTETIPSGWDVAEVTNKGVVRDKKITWSFSAKPGMNPLHYWVRAPSGFTYFSGTIGDSDIIGKNRLEHIYAHAEVKPSRDWQFWRVADGLSSPRMGRIIINPTKSIFVEDAIHQGWNRMDGYTVSFIPQPRRGATIRESISGQIWSASIARVNNKKTLLGFQNYNETWSTYPITTKSNVTEYISFMPMEHNQIYVLFKNTLAVWHAEKDKLQTLISSFETCLTAFNDFTFSSKNEIWICGDEGLAKFSPKENQCGNHPIDPNLRLVNVHNIKISPDRIIYLSAVSKINGKSVIVKFDRHAWTVLWENKEYIHGFSGNNQSLWIHDTRRQSLLEYDFIHKRTQLPQTIFASMVKDIAMNPHGNSWVSTSEGLAHHTQKLWRAIFQIQKHRSPIYHILESPQGRLWFINHEALICYEDEQWSIYSIPSTVKKNTNQSTTLSFKKNEKILIRGFCQDLNINKQKECLLLFDPANETFDVYDEGYVYSRAKSKQKVNPSNPFPLDPSMPRCPGGILLCTYTDRNGAIWGGTENEVWLYQGVSWKRMRTKLGTVHQIFSDTNGFIWVASDTGVHNYRKNTWQTYRTENGLPSNQILSIYEDSSNKIWAGASEGISQFQAKGDTEPPETYFTKETRLNQHTIPPNRKIRITYAGIDSWKSTSTERLLFSYSIDGSAWSAFEPATLFSPTSLSTGTHEIKVRAMDQNWNIDPTPATFSFTIMLPWYKEPNFIITFTIVLCIILFLMILHIFNYINLAKLVTERTQHLVNYQKQLQALATDLSLTEERERRKIASDLHDSISQSLSLSILELSAFPDPQSTLQTPLKIESIRSRLNETLQTLQNMTFDLCPPELYQIGLESAIKELTLHMGKQYAINISFQDDMKNKPLSDDMRYFLFRATRELLINATKHANASHILVQVYKQGNYIHIIVKDDGMGFCQDHEADMVFKKGGFGLFNLQERLNSCGGSMSMESNPSQGTSVSIIAPLTACGD